MSLYTNVDLCVIYLYPQKNDRIYTIWKFEKVTLTGSGGQNSGPPLWEWTHYLRWIYRPFLKLLNMIDRSAEADTARRFVRYYFLSQILSKKSPDLHDFYVTLSVSGGGVRTPPVRMDKFSRLNI